MKSHLGTLAIAALVLAASAGCAHRTTTVHRSDTVRTDTSRPEVVPQPVVEDSTTVIKRSHSSTEGTQP
jgi:hypothetical protein